MSGKNGNGRIGRYQKRVAEAAGLKDGDLLPYAPDYLDSLATRMATPGGDWAERTFAWLVYRASGNQDLAAIHIYSHAGKEAVETELRQRDCCLDLAWLEAGHRWEWLDAPLSLFRQEAARRGVEPVGKNHISEGFTENRDRGIVASNTGHRLVLVPSPKVPDSRENLAEKEGKGTFHERFEAWAKVAHSPEYQEREVARSVNKRITNFLLSEYKRWLKSATPQPNPAPSLETLETVEPLEAPQPSSVSQSSDRPTDEQDVPPSPVPEEAAERMQALLLDELGQIFPGVMPGRSLCLLTIQALGEADWDLFRGKLRGHRWDEKDTMGLAKSLAAEVRERWIKDEPRRRREREIAALEAERLEKQNAEIEAEAAAVRRGEEVWESLTAPERSDRVATQLAAVVKSHPRMPPHLQNELAAQLAKHEFTQRYGEPRGAAS